MKLSPQASIEITRRYPVRRELVFLALSDAELVQRWFFPSPDVRLTVERFDFRVGGKYRFAYELPDGNLSRVHGQFEQIEEPELLVFTWTWEPPDPHAGERTIVRMKLVEQTAETLLTVTHERLPEDYRGLFEPGWQRTLEHLWATITHRHVARRKP